ncbi:MAG: hypothetical protein G01um101429_356 [Parcubacteria group bacterium Gr01-1014_29]|nr:MAG: hypothetical protein G01um101429_356 [Parcubacteria group bacterium Gr01-1014_29]
MERKVVTTIGWKFSGVDSIHHTYLAVYGLMIRQVVSEKTGELYFWVQEVDDGQNMPNERSMETVRGMVRNLRKQVESGTFLSLEKSQAISEDPFKLTFEIPDGVHFIDHAVTLSNLIFQIFDLKIMSHNLDQVRITNEVFVRESSGAEFVEETKLLQQQLNRALERIRR